MANFAAPKIATYAPDVAPSFARVIDRALEFKREDRYTTAEAMQDDVRRALGEMDGVARTELAVPVSQARPPAKSRAPRSGPPKPRSDPPPPLVPMPPLPSPPPLPREATMEISERDLEPSLPVLPTERRKRRRSVLPWITVVLFVGIAGKLWMDARDDGEQSAAGAASGVTSASAEPSATVPSSPQAPAASSASTSASSTAAATVHSAPLPTATVTTAPRPTTAPKPAHQTPLPKHGARPGR